MARSNNEKKVVEGFLNIYNKHGNPMWAYEELEYLVFVKHREELHKLDFADQWEIRECMFAFKKIYK